MMNDDLNSFEGALKKAELFIREKDFQGALSVLDAQVSSIEADPSFKDDEVSEYRHFYNTLEEVLYMQIYEPTKEVRAIPQDFPMLYMLHGIVFFELKRFEDAIEALKKAVKLNPMCTEFQYEMAEAYKMYGNLEKYHEITKICLGRSYKPTQLSRGYRNLGYYYIEKKDYEMAIACLHFSLVDENSKMAESELRYIEKTAGIKVKCPSFKAIKKLFDKEEIPLGADELVRQAAWYCAIKFEKANAMDSAKFFYKVIYDLTGSEKAEAKLKEL